MFYFLLLRQNTTTKATGNKKYLIWRFMGSRVLRVRDHPGRRNWHQIGRDGAGRGVEGSYLLFKKEAERGMAWTSETLKPTPGMRHLFQ